jgi:hypothetical protein
MRDDGVRRELERLAVPPEDPEFFASLRVRIRERELASARRWRRASIALAAVAVAAVAAAALVATARGGGAVLDRTLSCAVPDDGGVAGVVLDAWPPTPGGQAAGLRLGGDAELLGFASSVTGFVLDGSRCRSSSADVPLDAPSLPSVGVFGAGYTTLHARCFPSGRLLVRIRLALDGEGRPHRATLALRGSADGRPLAVVRWSPDLVQAWASADCPAG